MTNITIAITKYTAKEEGYPNRVIITDLHGRIRTFENKGDLNDDEMAYREAATALLTLANEVQAMPYLEYAESDEWNKQ